MARERACAPREIGFDVRRRDADESDRDGRAPRDREEIWNECGWQVADGDGLVACATGKCGWRGRQPRHARRVRSPGNWI
jgi:hypothetical protein